MIGTTEANYNIKTPVFTLNVKILFTAWYGAFPCEVRTRWTILLRVCEKPFPQVKFVKLLFHGTAKREIYITQNSLMSWTELQGIAFLWHPRNNSNIIQTYPRCLPQNYNATCFFFLFSTVLLPIKILESRPTVKVSKLLTNSSYFYLLYDENS